MSVEYYNRVSDKLRIIEEHLGYLHKQQGLTEEEFTGEFLNFNSAERSFQVIIDAIIDVAKILVIRKGLTRAEDNQELLVVLHDADVLSEELTSKLHGVVGFRNLLVHEYGAIDRHKVYENLQGRLTDFESFIKEIALYLDSK